MEKKRENVISRPTKEYIYTQPSEFLPGNLNPLNTRIVTKCLNIDTRYRTNILNTNSFGGLVCTLYQRRISITRLCMICNISTNYSL